MGSTVLYIGIGVLALVALVSRLQPQLRGTASWREVIPNWREIVTVLRDPRRRIRRPAFMLSRGTTRYRKLSLLGRTAVGLVCFERYCQAKGLRHPLIDEFVDHMWELPCITFLPDWEKHKSELFYSALGHPFPPEILESLKSAGVTEIEFRPLVENCVEIFYCSAYAGSDNAESLRALDQVLRVTSNAAVTPPPVRPFLLSLFVDGHGWGKRVSTDQRDGWRFGAYDDPMA